MTKQHIEFVLSGYGVPYTDALANKLLEMFDEEAASYLHTINKLNKALSKNKGEWIPVSERLPKAYQKVLVTYEEIHWANEPTTYGVKLISFGGVVDFIAWQPLPEPYKAESEDI